MTSRIPDLDAEQELDLGRLWAALATRWWLLAAGLVAGAILGYLVSLGGGATWRAQAVVFLGQPLSPNGGAQLQSLATNPSTVSTIVRAESTIQKVAADTALKPAKLRADISTTAVAGAIAKLGQTPLVTISVKGTPPRAISAAANELADIVVQGVSSYTNTKINGLQTSIASDQAEIASIDARLQVYNEVLPKAAGLTDKLIILTQAGLAEQRRGIVESDMTQSRNLLSLATSVEASRVVTHAVAQKVSARSRRNGLLIGAFIGLVLGLLAALLWEPAARVARRSGT